MYRQILLAFPIWFLIMPAQAKLAKLPQSPGDAAAFCSRVGEVRGRDVFAQTFLLEQDHGQMATVPFSRWTEFFKISPGRNPWEIEPTDILPGDRLCVLLDPSEATARLILVLDRVRTPASIALRSDGSIHSDRRRNCSVYQTFDRSVLKGGVSVLSNCSTFGIFLHQVEGDGAYLNVIEQVGCVYCSYANGLLA